MLIYSKHLKQSYKVLTSGLTIFIDIKLKTKNLLLNNYFFTTHYKIELEPASIETECTYYHKLEKSAYKLPYPLNPLD